MRLIAHHDARRFFQKYLLVGASSWSPPDYASFANLAGLSDDPIFIGISNVTDVGDYQLFNPVIAAVPLMACDWIDPERYHPRPYASREIDILMVANWLPFKRHWLLFEALRRMDQRLRVVLIGHGGHGRTADDVWREARLFGVRQELELLTNVGTNDIVDYQCNSKIGALFSDREGSCVAVTESMFADAPVAMMKDAHVGAKAHINAQTGALVTRGTIHLELSALLERAGDMNARAWATSNISCQKSSELLNRQLRDYCQESGQPWTRDIVPLQWRYVPAYLRDSDQRALQPGVDQLLAEYGIELVRYSYNRPGAQASS
jgi:glycosyltransferase involved in cell wall biosynthesis